MKRSKRTWNSGTVGLVLVLALMGGACGADETPTANDTDAVGDTGGTNTQDDQRPAQQPEMSSVTVGLPVLTSTFAPIYVAIEEGYFSDEGIEVELATFSGGTDLVRAMVGGSADIGVTSLAGVLTAVQQDQPLKVFYGAFNMPVFEFYATPEVESIEDGRGLAWGVTRAGSSTDFLTRYALRENGLDPERDVNIVQGGRSAERFAAMEAGQLQVNIFAPPETFIAEEAGYNQILRLEELLPEYPNHVAFASESFLADNPGTTEAFLRGLVRGIRTVKDDPELAADVLVETVEIEEQYAQPTLETFVDKLHEDGRLPDDASMDAFWDLGVEAEIFPEAIPEEQFMDRTYIDSFEEWAPSQNE